jgi:hypothetical protein
MLKGIPRLRNPAVGSGRVEQNALSLVESSAMKNLQAEVSSAVLPVMLMLCVLFADVISCMAEPQWQAGGAVGLFSAKRGSSDPSVPSHLIPGLGGTSFSADLSLDRIVNSRISVGTELAGGADIKGRQSELTAGTFGTLNGRHSDTILVGTVKANMFTFAFPNSRSGTGIELIGVAGAGPSWRHTEREGLVQELQGGTRDGSVRGVFDGGIRRCGGPRCGGIG